MSDLLSDSGAGNGESIVTPDAPIVVTGASGFIGAKVVETLLESGSPTSAVLFEHRTDRIAFGRSSIVTLRTKGLN